MQPVVYWLPPLRNASAETENEQQVYIVSYTEEDCLSVSARIAKPLANNSNRQGR